MSEPEVDQPAPQRGATGARSAADEDFAAGSKGVNRPVLIVPGLHNSGPDHWQSHWERTIPGAERVEQADWEHPNMADWIATLAEAVRRRPGAVLVAHSLGCALISHLAMITKGRDIAGALLVAPADVNRTGLNADRLRTFSPQPLGRLPFPTITVISRNDPYVSFERGDAFAAAWGSERVDLGLAGHINIDSGFGPWPEGQAYLGRLSAMIVSPGQLPPHPAVAW